MKSLDIAIEGIEASKAPNVSEITFRVENDRVVPYFTMSADENLPSFVRVVASLPYLVRRLDAEIRAGAGSLHVLVSIVDYVGDDGKPEPGDGLILAEPARGGSRH